MIGLIETQFRQTPDDQDSIISETHVLDNSDYSIDELIVSSDDSNIEMSVMTIPLY